MNIKKTITDEVIYRVKTLVSYGNYWLHNYDEVIWLIGDGRSGTTWVSDLINHDRRYREMFEPFHPQAINDMRFLLPNQYLRPDASDSRLEKVAREIFTGRFNHPRVDTENRSVFYKGLLIKDIFANLFAYWASIRFPRIKIILLIRNPFSVALSKHKKKHWYWMTDPLELLKQQDLREDYLYPFEDAIREVHRGHDYILCQILIWAILNYVPLCQFKSGQIHVVFYEDVFTNPNHELSEIFRFVNPHIESFQGNIKNNIVKRPSRVSGKESNVLRGTSPITSWKNELSPTKIDDGLRILRLFGFEGLYDDHSVPNRSVLSQMHKKA